MSPSVCFRPYYGSPDLIRRTLQRWLNKLIEDNQIAAIGDGRSRKYIALINQAEATQVIAKYEGVMIRANVFDPFIAACDEVKAPNKALLEAMAFTKQGEFK
ncbi:DUF1778 domain-containing protein [Photobacterium phosphoreum]|uniref:type II toxin -antitoxin system TacA 1-like antitoxin n=1 Tax=Photobacterium phosphoreum TaxID=659 RepID=UPI0039B07A07